jgi:hypothetical protein
MLSARKHPGLKRHPIPGKEENKQKNSAAVILSVPLLAAISFGQQNQQSAPPRAIRVRTPPKLTK